MSAAQGNQAAAGADVARGVIGMSLPRDLLPKLDSTFSLYEIELELYLSQFNLWEIVDGIEVRHDSDAELQAEFDKKDNVARMSILSGMTKQDKEFLHRSKTAHDFERCKNSLSCGVDKLGHLYHNICLSNMDLNQWLASMDDMRNELIMVGRNISDDHYAEILLFNTKTAYCQE